VHGVKILRADDCNDPPSEMTTLEIDVRNPSVKYKVSLQQVARWLNGASSSPAESQKKVNLRMITPDPGCTARNVTSRPD
jgi:hypothetical protein